MEITESQIDVLPPQMATQSDSPAPRSVLMYLRGNDAGIRIDASSAFRYTASWACIRVITDTIAMLPWHSYRRKENGDREKVAHNHRMNQLLNVSPNDEMSAFVFRETMLANALTWGDAYAEIERDMSGAAIKLWPIEPHRIQIERNRETEKLEYLVDGRKAVIKPVNMFHLKGLGSTGLMGFYVVGLFAQAFATGLAAEKHSAQFFGQGAIPTGLLKSSARINEATSKEYIRSFEENHLKNRRIGLLQPNMDFEVISATNEDSQLLQTRQFAVQEMCRIFRVPPHKISDLSKSAFSNIESQETSFARDSIAPWCKKMEQEADWKLIGPRGKRANIYTEFNLNALMRGDSEARVKFYTGLRDLGVLTPNDILRLENMNAIEGPEGDKRLVPLNMTTLEKAGEPQEPDPAVNPFGEDGTDEEENEDPTEDKDQEASPSAMVFRHVIADHCDYFQRITESRIQGAVKRYDSDEKLLSWLSSYYAKQPHIMLQRLLPVARSYLEMINNESKTGSFEVVISGWCVTQSDQDFKLISQNKPEETLEQWKQSWTFNATNSFLTLLQDYGDEKKQTID